VIGQSPARVVPLNDTSFGFELWSEVDRIRLASLTCQVLGRKTAMDNSSVGFLASGPETLFGLPLLDVISSSTSHGNLVLRRSMRGQPGLDGTAGGAAVV
jgi:hypothetical protein